ncbi:E3 ubiquitin-protein ligase RNF217-like [Saccostrea cucullata]|uniref:E3 ubiquitin-protein ligase RNF217-like n=1 Tax=Saccostrea cuccullata TaxID=36930 RepID=UPI002ED4A49E
MTEYLTFRTLSSEKLYNVPKFGTVDEIRRCAASMLYTEYWLIDVVNIENFFIYDPETTSDVLHNPFHVMVWAESRPLSGCITTTKPDIIWEYESDPRLELPCGHAITPDNLFGLLREKIRQNEYCICCPGKTDSGTCNELFDNQLILKKCMLSADEYLFYSGKLSFNYINASKRNEIKNCPRCDSYCKKMNIFQNHIKCFKCSNEMFYSFKFCWYCSESWTQDHECSSANENEQNIEIVRQLENCSKITLGYSNMENVPSIRLCPNCKTLLQHDQACKSMICTICKTEFCFACLKIAFDGKLQCGEFNGRCNVAPIQSVE